jgi:hypothetical protein
VDRKAPCWKLGRVGVSSKFIAAPREMYRNTKILMKIDQKSIVKELIPI